MGCGRHQGEEDLESVRTILRLVSTEPGVAQSSLGKRTGIDGHRASTLSYRHWPRPDACVARRSVPATSSSAPTRVGPVGYDQHEWAAQFGGKDCAAPFARAVRVATGTTTDCSSCSRVQHPTDQSVRPWTRDEHAVNSLGRPGIGRSRGVIRGEPFHVQASMAACTASCATTAAPG